MKDTADDPVVYETDVHFAPKRKGDLYLLQFSHNASPFSAKRKRLGPIRAKPKSSQFEIELLMDQHSDTFDRDKSKEIARKVDDENTEEADRYFPNQMMTKQLLNSERLASTGFPFALAYLRSDLDNVRLIPVKSVLDFKPTFRYLDRAKFNAGKKNTGDDSDEDDEMDEALSKPEPVTKKITMRFENKRAADSKPVVAAANLENEDWTNVQYFDYGQSKFEREKDVLLYKTNQEADEAVDVEEDRTPAGKKFSYEEFARCAEEVPDFRSSKEIRIDLLHTMPFHQTSSLPLRDQVRSILVSSKVIPFNKCVQLLTLNVEKNRLANAGRSNGQLNGQMNGQINGQLNGPSRGRSNDKSKSKSNDQSNEQSNDQANSQSNTGLDLDLVLRYLEQYAQLVQGNWVVKSEAIYPKRPKNAGRPSIFDLNSIPFTDISVDMLKNARDYVLYRFTKEESLSRLELIEQIRVPANVIGEILGQLSTFNAATRSWDFVYPRDEAFIEQHQQLADRQAAQWQEMSCQLLELFS